MISCGLKCDKTCTILEITCFPVGNQQEQAIPVLELHGWNSCFTGLLRLFLASIAGSNIRVVESLFMSSGLKILGTKVCQEPCSFHLSRIGSEWEVWFLAKSLSTENTGMLAHQYPQFSSKRGKFLLYSLQA